MATYQYQLLLKHLLEHGVSWVPDQEIVYREHFRYRYEDMYQRVMKLASGLKYLGVKQGTKVGVIEWDSHRYLEMYFGIPGLGAVLHTINPNLAQENVLHTIQHAEDEILIFHEDFRELVEQIRDQLPSVKTFIVISENSNITPDADYTYEELLELSPPLPELPEFNEDAQATLSYTTGTTGQPKGVYFSHRQLVLHTFVGWGSIAMFGNDGGLSKHDVYMPLTPMFHVHAWGVPYVATVYGLKQVYPGRYDYDRILRLMKKESVSFSHCVPTILQQVLDAAVSSGQDLAGWKVIIGGARLTKGLAMAARDLGVEITAGYGLSESCPFLTLASMRTYMEKDWSEEAQMEVRIKTGFPMPLVKYRVVGSDGKDVSKDGEQTGEIVLRSPWLTEGYYKDPELSEQLWAGDWMHTGDVANIDQNGYVQIVDRMKDIIKSGGEWIVSLELENLLSLHTDVLEAGVIGIPHEKWGERPLAIIAAREGSQEELTAEALQTHLASFVSEGQITKWAVPERFVFVDQLPKTSVGKIDKKELRRRYSSVFGD
ncbi:MAG: long-chain-fatty-acid--CoA ligase [Anaerolineales bacterium]